LTIAFNDVDNNIYQRDVRLRTLCGDTHEYRAEESSSFLLDPPQIFSNTDDDILLFNMPQ
ncbi:MAG: hypothetical protein AB7D05_11335, partial [Mangrovibacterium sp.]